MSLRVLDLLVYNLKVHRFAIKGVAECCDFGPIKRYILETVQDIGKLVLITNRKSYMSFRLVLKSVTLNDLE